MFFNQFIRDESGAFTVDWVVLVAGLVAIGMTTVLWVSGGYENQSADITNAMATMDPTAHYDGFGEDADL